MHLQDFSYELPDELIALYPTPERSQSRLLCLDASTGAIDHHRFYDLLDYLKPGDLLVFNDTKVIPARIFGHKESGGAVEVLIERIGAHNRVVCYLRANKPPRFESRILFQTRSMDNPETTIAARVVGREGEFYVLQFPETIDLQALLAEIGHIPLPPYIKREDQLEDVERYQTVYAKNPGAVAAPTAGLHFDDPLLRAISDKGVETAYLTLHVGAGTFTPVRVDDIQQHKMHSERIDVSEQVCEQVYACKQRGGRVVAVGTTTVRSLESAAKSGKLQSFRGETDIFIYPGYEFRVVDAMVTNFHLPESTLLMLVSAFAGKEILLGAYQAAIENRYRFFSYGDAMLLYKSGMQIPDEDSKLVSQ